MTGRDRLENWANWARYDNPRLDYPKICAWARHYRPEAGDIWLETAEREFIEIDEIDAERVEGLIIGRPARERKIIRAFHVERYRPGQIARLWGLQLKKVLQILNNIEECLEGLILKTE